MKNRVIAAAVFLVWFAIVLTLFFVVQKPAALQAASGLASLAATLLFAALFVGAGMGIGYLILTRLNLDSMPSQRLIIAAGLGMGVLGLTGFGLAAFGLARAWVTIGLLAGILLWSAWRRLTSLLREDLRILWIQVRESAASVPPWITWFAAALALFSFLLALAPPVEAFDGLLYHLTVPSLWLRDGGIRQVNMPHYWYPSLMEGMFLWPLSVGLDSAPQLIHFVFGLLGILLILDWTRRLFGSRAAGWAIAIFLSMPSLPWLAAWAYTDLGLIFYSLGALLALSNERERPGGRWLVIAGWMTGFAMGIKYTSFVLPLVIFVFLIWRNRSYLRQLSLSLLGYGAAALAVGFPWYLRNWLWMGNPFYPFLFGGPYWDAFRSAWYAGAGSGTGWNFSAVFSLPFAATLGYRDVNYFDGRFGPFFLILSPLILWLIWRTWKESSGNKDALAVLVLFSILSIGFWTLGVIQTRHLMQARLLWPGLIPLIPIMSAGILELEKLDTPKFRLSFVFSAVGAVTVFSFVLDFCLLAAVRNPLLAAIGLESREVYTARLQPKYAQALTLVNQTPQDAFVYFLNEPRSYGMSRRVQPDPINDNLHHDFHLYRTIPELLDAWRELGYTHVLAARDAFETDSGPGQPVVPGYFERVKELEQTLILVGKSKGGDYVLFAIPPK